MTERSLTTGELNSLFPIRNLSDEHKSHLQKTLSTENVGQNSIIFSEKEADNKQLYLLEGKIKLVINEKDERIIEGGNMEARFPLDNNSPHQASAIALSDSVIFYVEKSTLTNLANESASGLDASSIDVTEDDSESLLYNQLYFEVTQEMQAGRLELPSIPETASKVRTAIADDNISSDQIAKIVQTDPAITAQIIKVANSPLFRGREKIESLPNAVTRLGLKAIGNLITSFTMRMIFNAKTKEIKQHISDLWLHSRTVSSICAVMAKRLKGFDADKAMLAGLMHDIGAIPILTHADKHPNLTTNPVEVQQALHNLTPIVGKMIMENWNFTEDFVALTVDAEKWDREVDTADYTDLIIVAQLMSFKNTPLENKHPEPSSVPAYNRLVKKLRDPSGSINIIEDARDELFDIQQLFN